MEGPQGSEDDSEPQEDDSAPRVTVAETGSEEVTVAETGSEPRAHTSEPHDLPDPLPVLVKTRDDDSITDE